MKAKSMYYSKTGNSQIIATELGRIYQCVSDQIPPAFPCDGEKLLFVGVEMDKNVEKHVVDFCRDLKPSRAKNVAFYVVSSTGSTSALDALKSTVKANGVNIAGDTLVVEIKNSIFKKGKVSDEDLAKVRDWAADIVNSKLVG